MLAPVKTLTARQFPELASTVNFPREVVVPISTLPLPSIRMPCVLAVPEVVKYNPLPEGDEIPPVLPPSQTERHNSWVLLLNVENVLEDDKVPVTARPVEENEPIVALLE